MHTKLLLESNSSLDLKAATAISIGHFEGEASKLAFIMVGVLVVWFLFDTVSLFTKKIKLKKPLSLGKDTMS
ncbi:MAG: hypothetical protein R2852_04660 [Bacteroidia bacterium]